MRKLFITLLAICMGSSLQQAFADDTAALQQQVNTAIASGQSVRLSPRQYTISRTIAFAPAGGRGRVQGLTVEGAGVGKTVISWIGPPDASIFLFKGMFQGLIRGFSMAGRPSLASLDFASNGSSGSTQIENVVIGNPAKFSVRLGNPTDYGQVSEFSFSSVATSSARTAGFQIEGGNTLNINFYNSSCGQEPICTSNSAALDPPTQSGGNFNWFGGSVSYVPSGNSPTGAAVFVLASGGTYNFVGVRLDMSTPVLFVGNSAAKVQVNWIGNTVINSNGNGPIVNYNAGGSFYSQASMWGARGSFQFGPRTQSAVFAGDTFRVATGFNTSIKDYFVGASRAEILSQPEVHLPNAVKLERPAPF
jgi:hypothetical protein